MNKIVPSASTVDFSRVRGVLFDLGGTLDGDGEHWLNRFWLLYQKHFPELGFEAVKAAFYQAEEACLTDPRVASFTLPRLVAFHVERQLAVLGFRPEAGEKLAWEFLEGCRRVIRRNAYVLRDLAQDYRLGVVTNGYGNASLLLAGEAIAIWFAVIVDSGRVGLRKPDPQIFRLAARELGFPPAEVVYVGDSYINDIRPAKGEGFITVWLRNDPMNAPLPPDADPSLADFVIRSLPELTELLP